jgi:glycerate 2-kinase
VSSDVRRSLDGLAADADAREIFRFALERTQVGAAIMERVTCQAGVLAVDSHRYELRGYEHVFLIAIGKAAGEMAAAFLRIVEGPALRIEGVVAGVCEQEMPERVRVFRSGHPNPDQASLDAAVEILHVLERATERDLVVFLISGGGSSMVEQMLRGGASLKEIRATHKVLVESGAPIAEINAVRKHLSAVKGGRLAAAAAPAEQVTIFVSDVPEGKLDALASGPTLPDRSSVADVLRIVKAYGLATQMPEVVAASLMEDVLVETPKAGDAIFSRSQWVTLLDSVSLEMAARERAEDLGWTVVVDNSCDDWSAEDAAGYLVRRLEQLRAVQPRVCLLSAGEVTVKVPAGGAGQGGRNQHFALLCSRIIEGRAMTILSAGSDGIDGNSPAAGAVVDGTTAARAEGMGFVVARALEEFDSYGLISVLGDGVITGLTGNNLRDLRVLLAP